MSEEDSFVRIDNGNLVQLNLRSLAKNFANYTKLMLEIKEISDSKVEVKKDLKELLKQIDRTMKETEEMLPEIEIPKMKRRTKRKSRDVEISGDIDSFSNLKQEFLRLKEQLEGIKKGL